MTDKLKDFEEDIKALTKQYWGNEASVHLKRVVGMMDWFEYEILIKYEQDD